MPKSLFERCTGTAPPLPSRLAGPAALMLLGIGLVTAPAFAGKPTPYGTINRVAASGPITVHKLRGGIAMLEGSGGNIGVLAEPGGVLMVDTGIRLGTQDQGRHRQLELAAAAHRDPDPLALGPQRRRRLGA